MNLYSVFDKRAQQFQTPFALPAHAHALRSLTAEVRRVDPGNMLNLYPEDFALYHIAEFDPENGSITPFLDLVVEAITLITPKGNPNVS